jgi:retron-type reverse transcriptase
LLEAPKPRLRQLQRYILDDILAHIPPHPAAHGFRTGHSIATSAAAHVGRAVVIRLDLQTFFTSVVRARVVAIFRSAGYPERVARTLAALCTHGSPPDVLHAMPRQDTPVAAPSTHDVVAARARMLARLHTAHLPQGAPTSGALANLAAHGFDVRVHALAMSIGASYTRYADDLAISGGRELARAAPTIIARVGAIAFEEGFALNFRKTRVMTASTQQRITGLVVNDRLAVPRVEIERLRAILHNCVRTGPAAQNRDSHADFRAHLLGRIAWVASVDAHKGARLRAVFERIVW